MCDYDTQHPSAKLRSANREVRTSAGLLKPDTGGNELAEMGWQETREGAMQI